MCALPTRRLELLRGCREFLGNPILADLSREAVVQYITRTGKTEYSRASLRGAVVAFLSWCGEHGYTERAKFHGLKWPKIRKDKERPPYLSIEEVRRLFRFAVVYVPGGNGCRLQVDEEKSLRFKAALACALFLGVRPGTQAEGGGRYGELPMLQFDFFNLEEKTAVLPARITKTREERVISEIPENVLQLFRACKFKAGEYVLPFGYQRYRSAVRRVRKDIEKAGFPSVTWCQKIFRHTFATYGYWRGLEWVIEAGGWQDPRLLTKHYRGGCRKEESLEFFKIDLLNPKPEKAGQGVSSG